MLQATCIPTSTTFYRRYLYTTKNASLCPHMSALSTCIPRVLCSTATADITSLFVHHSEQSNIILQEGAETHEPHNLAIPAHSTIICKIETRNTTRSAQSNQTSSSICDETRPCGRLKLPPPPLGTLRTTTAYRWNQASCEH